MKYLILFLMCFNLISCGNEAEPSTQELIDSADVDGLEQKVDRVEKKVEDMEIKISNEIIYFGSRNTSISASSNVKHLAGFYINDINRA